MERLHKPAHVVSLLLLLISLCELTSLTSAATSASSLCRNQRTCKDCISISPECSWCSDEADNTTASPFRCSLVSESRCNKTTNPRSEIDSLVRDDDYSNITSSTGTPPVQLKPQEVNINMRPGEPYTINITFEKTVEYPLDLYYVMDLSNSMKDDLATLQNLGGNLITDIRKNVTKNVKLGFGSFVDKVMMPYASTVDAHLLNPCDKGDCGPVFGFRHQLSITENGEQFKDAVANTNISGNIDSPEGGFDALMQIAVCQDQIGWRKDALRVILYASDASPHIALDGKLAAILEANDQECHLERGANKYLKDAMVYSKSKELDYPSVGQLRDVFKKHKITTIFAVTTDVFELYKDLEKVLGNSFAGELEEDSSNVVEVISNSYNKLKSLITLSPPTLPDNVVMTYRVLCPNRTTWEENKLQCSNAGNLKDKVTFQFTFNAKSCPTDGRTNDTVTITSGQLNDETKLTFLYQCSCECSAFKIPNSNKCSNKGDYECGTCNCFTGYAGRSCQCDGGDESEFEATCKPPTILSTSSSSAVCSGNGFCECGNCVCYDQYFDNLCQCIATGCSSNEDGVCGGADKGVCKNCNGNKECKCIKGYKENDKTKTCTCHDKFCNKNQNETGLACGGRGKCNCDKCTCDIATDKKPLFRDAFCEECIHPDCKEKAGTCEEESFSECARCIYNVIRVNTRKSVLDECGSNACKSITFDIVDKIPNCETPCNNGTSTDECKACEKVDTEHISDDCKSPIDEVACDVSYKIVWDTANLDYLLYVKKYDPDFDCQKPIDPLMIVFPVVGGILLIGFILLVVWKAYTHFRDKVEYRTFLEDQKKSRWTQGENPLFSKASVRVENPAFIGK